MREAIKNDEQLAEKVIVSSSGIAAFEGDRASESSVKVLREGFRIDISSHRARRITEEQVQNADLVLTMTRSHRNTIISVFPWAKGKVFTLKEYAQNNGKNAISTEYDFSLDIMDPYGMPVEVYRKCSEELKNVINRLISKIKSLI